MKNKFTSNAFKIGLIFLIFITGCKKEILKTEKTKNVSNAKTSLNSFLLASEPTFPLDWENISFMPRPTGLTPIPVPWQGGLGGTKIDADIIFDYHSINGWELVYNTFRTDRPSDILYFMLYNKYRGVLRTYFYFAPNSNFPSSNISHFLEIGGTSINSSILNFAGQEVIDVNSNSSRVGQMQPYKISSTGSWYAAEFEIAYDPTLSTRQIEQTRLNWTVVPTNISTIVLNGMQTGDISGTITSTTSQPSFFSAAANGIVAAAGLNIGDNIKTNALQFLPAIIKTPIVNASVDALGGIVKGFLSGILGGTSNQSVEKVSLKINTQINFTGTSATQTEVFANVFSIPGMQGVHNTLPYYPSYENLPGVFNISNKPTVVRTTNVTLESPYYYIQQNYQVQENSFTLIFNPTVTAIANIVNVRKEVVILDYDPHEEHEMSGILEQVAEKTIYTSFNTLSYTNKSPRPKIQPNKLAVRITFDVVPKDGSPKCTIVKTFLANQG